MGSLFEAAAAFCQVAILGTGPAAGPADPHWERVKADLTAARAEERPAAQVRTLFPTGTPRPDMDR